MATATETRVRDPRDYVRPGVWHREIQLLMRDHPFDEVMADRLFGAASPTWSRRSRSDNGFAVDWKLWERDYAKCGPCRPGENCH